MELDPIKYPRSDLAISRAQSRALGSSRVAAPRVARGSRVAAPRVARTSRVDRGELPLQVFEVIHVCAECYQIRRQLGGQDVVLIPKSRGTTRGVLWACLEQWLWVSLEKADFRLSVLGKTVCSAQRRRRN